MTGSTKSGIHRMGGFAFGKISAASVNKSFPDRRDLDRTSPGVVLEFITVLG
jgi:hypothetical protein